MAKGDMSMEDFTSSLIKDLNKERGDRIAYNLTTDESPTVVKRWISTGVKQLDMICSNQISGGLPEGRIVEIFGPSGIGKSHLAAQICKAAQRLGGMAVYIDCETATSVENLQNLGVDIAKGFVYVDEQCTEHVLSIAESTIMKARGIKRDVPVVIIWDSVAASAPKAEIDGDYDKDLIGVKARAISKGMRKITNVIGRENVLFVCLNQVRTKIGVMFGDPDAPPGGQAIPFHSSIRIKLGAGSQIKNKDGEVIGINVSAKTIKNRLTGPFRSVKFQIHFGVGIKEHEELFDRFRKAGPQVIGSRIYHIGGDGAWKFMRVWEKDANGNSLATEEALEIAASKKPEKMPKEAPATAIVDKKFYKSDFEEMMRNSELSHFIDEMLESVMIVHYKSTDIDAESYVEVQALADQVSESIGEFIPPE